MWYGISVGMWNGFLDHVRHIPAVRGGGRQRRAAKAKCGRYVRRWSKVLRLWGYGGAVGKGFGFWLTGVPRGEEWRAVVESAD